ncbi:hypothetical protein SO802_002611 [Lithocarpus litseifolius]|uniref:Aminotransferase-like plant mobile domain-containing protein n=1 Tax=Lithocarpus litseifolius TaxID=425828 RepID=A0AAW2E0C0_9ROSI
MARAFLLYILEAYLFANGGQMMSLRLLSLFWDFEEARKANWGQTYLAYLYLSLDTFSKGTLHLMVGPWKLLEVIWSLWAGALAIVDPNLEVAAIITSKIT